MVSGNLSGFREESFLRKGCEVSQAAAKIDASESSYLEQCRGSCLMVLQELRHALRFGSFVITVTGCVVLALFVSSHCHCEVEKDVR